MDVDNPSTSSSQTLSNDSEEALSGSLNDLLRRLAMRGVPHHELSALQSHVQTLVKKAASHDAPPSPDSPTSGLQSAHLKLEDIRARSDRLVASFQLPDNLDLSPPSNSSSLKLVHVPANLSTFRLAEGLNGLIAELDLIDDPDVREPRKETILHVQRALAHLDEAIRLRRAQAQQDALRRVDAASNTFTTLYSNFVLPVALVYTPASSTEAFGLPISPYNEPVHTYHRDLSRIKVELSQIIAFVGNENGTRPKQLLETIDTELVTLEEDIQRRRTSPIIPATRAFEHALAAMAETLETRCAVFVFPTTLDLAPAPAFAPAGLVPAAQNRPVIDHYVALGKLMDRAEDLDTVGNDDARWKRKRFVHRINNELEKVEAEVQRRRGNQR
jgi:hypothetical protein